MKKTTKYEATAIITVLVLSIVTSCLEISYATNQEYLNPISEKNSNFSTQASYGKVGVEEHKITSAELGKLKSEVGVYQEKHNYNIVIDGHGTGLSPPTSDEWVDMAENAHVIDSVSYQSVPSAVDNSATPWFPPIGNQDGQGSCTAWAVGYYVKTFQEAKEHLWNLSGATWEDGYYGHPTLSYQSQIMSPAFIYHLINDGVDEGSNFEDAIRLVCFVGACSWQKMPYNPANASAWPSEAAWAEAPLYRGNSSFSYQYLYANTEAGLSSLKSWLASGNLATIAVDADQYDYLTSGDVWTTDNYHTVDLNHANTIVGYNDSITYMENGVEHSGAFKIANSWGIGSGSSGWENVPDGFYWISYETMKQLSGPNNPCMLFQDIVGYQPEILATFRINHAVRSDCQITFGLGTPTSPIVSKRFYNYVSGGAFPFCSNNIVLDITEFKSNMTSLYNQPFFMRVYDKGGGTGGGTVTTGTITYFGVGNAISTQTPVTTVNNGYVNLTLTYSLAGTTLNLSPTSGPPSGIVTLNGAGFTAGSSVNISYLNPVTSTWVPIINLATASENFTYTMNAPDLAQNNLAGDHQPLSDSVIFRAQDNSNGHSYTTAIPYTEWRRGLAQIGNSAATGLYGNNTNLAASFFVQNGGSILVCGEWFSPGNVSLLWDGVTGLGTILINETGFFNTTVLVPTTTAGQHTLVIRDNCSDFCFNLTRLPTVANDYMDLWHTSDFKINLAPDYSVNETFYKINDGPVYNVTANGPTITTEGGSNTLEYWSTWNICGTSNMELTHVILTGIKLDKAAPTGAITINNNYVNTATVTLALSAADSTSGISQMRFSNNNNDWSIWESYATSKTWNLQNGDGQKTVTVQYMDNAGLTSSYSCTVTLETPKSSPNPLTSTSPSPTPSAPSSVEPSASPEIPEFSIPAILGLAFISTLTFSLILKKKSKTTPTY